MCATTYGFFICFSLYQHTPGSNTAKATAAETAGTRSKRRDEFYWCRAGSIRLAALVTVMPMQCDTADLAIVGGGAAGLAAAIFAAEKAPSGFRIVVLDGAKTLGA